MALPKTTQTRRRPGGRSARVRTAVLDATLRELASEGATALSFERIARRAGVNPTTVYRRWQTREGLILDLMHERASQTVPIPDTGTLRGDLLALARDAVANASSPSVEAVIRAVIAELRHNEDIANTSRQFWAERMALDGEIVKRAIARDEVLPETEPRAVIEAVLAPLHLKLLIEGIAADSAQIERVVDIAVAAVTRTAPGVAAS